MQLPARKKLPIGIQSFRKIREGRYYYVDKTGHALRLIEEASYFFISRPRRFGKSLFLDTLKELFEGNEALFEGLEAQSHWDWSRYPVIRISFGGGVLMLQLFDLRRFRAFWYETGTPTFLLKLMRERQSFLPELSDLQTDSALLSTFDVGNMPLEALLFQSGYLTIAEETNEGGNYFYRLRFPNREVYQSLHNSFVLDCGPRAQAGAQTRARLYPLLRENDLAGMRELMKSFFASVPHQWYTNNPIAQYEGYHASEFYAFFASLGLDIRVEDSTNRGRLDMTVLFAGRALIFEFKVVASGPEGKALAQIKERGYPEKYQSVGLKVFSIGVEFSESGRRIVGWDVEEGRSK